MKLAFIGEAVSGFGGMETVIQDVIRLFHSNPSGSECAMFFFVVTTKWTKHG